MATSQAYAPLPPAPPVYTAVEHQYDSPDPTKRTPQMQAFHIDSNHSDHRWPTLSVREYPKPLKRAFTNLWIFEILCWLFALGCFIAIIVILAWFNEQPTPNWRWGITLPTVVSLLSSVATFALAVPIEAGLGQLMWLWFRKTRAASDFETISNAAAGPHGSFMLLLKMKGGPLAIVGALLTILLLAINPFVQQIILNEFTDWYNGGAYVPFATSYMNDTESVDVDLTMKAAINSGVLNYGNDSALFKTPAQCQTGNCSWENYKSLAVCGQCADPTNQLTIQPDDVNTNYTLPNGVSLIQDPLVIGVSMTVNNSLANASLTTIAFKDHHGDGKGGDLDPLVNVFVILGNYSWAGPRASDDDPVAGPYATECILEFCVQEYSTQETKGTFKEWAVGETVKFDAGLANRAVDVGPDSLTFNFLEVDGVNYTLGDSAMKAFGFYFTTLFAGSVAQYNSQSPQELWPSDLTQAIFKNFNSSSHSLDRMFKNIASSMTLNLRTQAGAGLVEGGSYVQQPIIIVRWVWISLPSALLVLALAFMLSVMVMTRRAGMESWKTSSVAALFALQGLRRKDEMEGVAETMFVKMGLDGKGQWVLQQRI